jgi:hypothetical protein
MQNIINNAAHNVVNHSADVNHAGFCGHSADCIDTAAKRTLGGKRLSAPALLQQKEWQPTPYQSSPSSLSGMSMPGLAAERLAASAARRRGTRRVPGSGGCPWTAGETPAAIWATLVVTSALCG